MPRPKAPTTVGWRECVNRGAPARVLKAGGESPYLLWAKAHRWMTKPSWRATRRKDLLRAHRMYHAVGRVAIKYEMEVAASVRLFDDVQPVLKHLRAVGIPVLIVSNNATDAIERVLKENNAEGLVDHVVGRDWRYDLIGNLKPKPLLVYKALNIAGCHAGRALLVGDSIDDMKAGRKAKIRFMVGLLEHSTAMEWQLRRAGAKLVLNRFGDLERLLPDGDPSRGR